MAYASGANSSAVKTVIRKIRALDYQTEANQDDITVPILVDNAAAHDILLLRVTAGSTEAWLPSDSSIKVGNDSDDDAYVTAVDMDSSNWSCNNGTATSTSGVTVTTAGANTGTAGAGLSLIGDTSTTDQSGAIMNDFRALQEDVTAIVAQDLQYKPLRVSFTAGDGVKATLVNGGANWSTDTTGIAYVIVEYIDLEDLP